ncbi:extracellular solute-binding protein [Streptomyces glaucus]|uniref:ABC transporter substrate-binding protein n=1 Tax=Streptomyces glaucus TaxID=284029 RepID=A0ABP5X8P2_9ACTN
MTRRLVALLALLLVAACTGGGHGADPAPSADVPGDIVIASGRDVTGNNGVRRQLIDAWNAEQERRDTGYRARLVELPGSADEQRSQLLGALQSGSAAYDVVNLDVTWVPEFAAAGLIRPLPRAMLDADVIPSVAGTARWDDRVYAVPFNSDVGLLYYRPDHLRQAGIHHTDLRGIDWDQLRNLINYVQARRPHGYEKGWTTQLRAYEGRTVNAVEAFASAVPGLTLTDDEGRYRADVDDLAQGVAELRRRTDDSYTLTDADRSDEEKSLADFAAGRTTFLRHWPYAYRVLHQTFDERRLRVAPLPGRAVLGGQNLAVTEASDQPGRARELIRFLTGRPSERCLLDAGFAATRTSAYRDDSVRCPLSAPVPSASPTGERADDMPRDERTGRPRYAEDILLPALQRAVPRPRTPLYGAFTQTFTAQLGPLFGADPPTDAELARRLDEALREALPD